MREQIEKTQVFLNENLPGMSSEISRLKTEGILDRRASSKIRNALNHARRSVTSLAESIGANERINGWNARMISYELGMAADTLTKQADPTEAALNARPNGERGATPDAISPAKEQQPSLAEALRVTSSLLKATAQAIVHHLK